MAKRGIVLSVTVALFLYAAPFSYADSISQTDDTASASAEDFGIFFGFTYTYGLGTGLSGTLDSLTLKFDGRPGNPWAVEFFCRTGSDFGSSTCTSSFGNATGLGGATTTIDGKAEYTATWSGTKTFEPDKYYFFQLRVEQLIDWVTPATLSGSAHAASYSGACTTAFGQTSKDFCTNVPDPYFVLNYTPVTPPTPVLSVVSIASNNASTGFAKVGDTVTVTFDSSIELGAASSTIAIQPATIATTTATRYIASYQMAAADTEGTVAFSLSYASLAGISGLSTTTTTDTSSVVFDKTPPTLDVI